MKFKQAGTLAGPVHLSETDFDLRFPEPNEPLLEGPGDPCTWLECMHETAVQTNHWLKHFGNEPPPPAWEERFTLD